MALKRVWAVLVLVLLGTGCAAERKVRLDTGEGPVRVHVVRADVSVGRVEGDAFQEAVRALVRGTRVEAAPRDAARELLGLRAYSRVRGRLGLVSVEVPGRGPLRVQEVGSELLGGYGRWCQRKGLDRDCLHLLDEGFTLDAEARRTLAFRLALESVWDETAEALGELADREAMVTMLATAGAFYLGLWLVPEPLLSKGIAAVLTVGLLGYLGWDTVWSLVLGWRVLAEEVEAAETFDEVRDAGEKYGRVMGRNAARVFVMLTLAALGGTAEAMAARITTLPGSAQAALVAAAQGGVRLGAAAQVEAVAVSAAGTVTLTLAPGAVAMVAQAAVSGTVHGEGHLHHIATNKWWDSAGNGGPWSPKFEDIFERAGLSLDDAVNTVRVPGHNGPHPEQYHREVYRRLGAATRSCSSMQRCRDAIVRELQKLARDITTPGSALNKLVTRAE